MNAERLNELKQRAARATELAEEIEAVAATKDKYSLGQLQNNLAAMVIGAGVDAVIKEKEAELERLLNPFAALSEGIEHQCEVQ